MGKAIKKVPLLLGPAKHPIPPLALGHSVASTRGVPLKRTVDPSEKSDVKKERLSSQGGPLAVINGVITPINGRFWWLTVLITLVIGVINPVITGRGPTLLGFAGIRCLEKKSEHIPVKMVYSMVMNPHGIESVKKIPTKQIQVFQKGCFWSD